jgi:hypothetical protein
MKSCDTNDANQREFQKSSIADGHTGGDEHGIYAELPTGGAKLDE